MLIRFEVPATVDEMIEAAAARSVVQPNTDALENENETIVLMEMPGVEKSAVKVSFERGILTVSAERKPLEAPEKGRVLMQELTVGGYRRSLRVHHPVETSAIAATLEDGVLRVVLPKAEIAKPRVIEVR